MPHLQTNCNNLKGEMALFSFPHTSGGAELRGGPLVYILVQRLLTSWKRMIG